jgi:uncharacterized protein DUF5658
MHAAATDRRSGIERRRFSIVAYWRGARNPRRRAGRRATDKTYPIVDWHSARVFAWVIAILALCVCDGVLTVMLIANGAVEANPILAKLVPASLGWFAAVKLTLTGGGIGVLVACSRMKLFRAISGEVFLALTFATYVALILYELNLSERIG